MKRIFALVGVVLVFCCGCSIQNDELVMVTEAGFSPYEYYSDGKIVGVDVDIAEEIAKAMGKKLVVKDVAFDSIIIEVKSGKASLGAAGISYNAERAKQVAFSNPYTISKQVIVVASNSNIVGVVDIDRKKMSVQLGSIADTYVTKAYPNNTIVRQKKYLAAIQDLKDGKVDCVVMDELPAQEIVGKDRSLRILKETLVEDPYGIIVNKENQELLQVVNRVIAELQSKGKIDEFILKHSSK